MNRNTWWWPGARPRIVSFTTWPPPRARTRRNLPVGIRASRSITITRTLPECGARVHSTAEVSVTSPAATPDVKEAALAGSRAGERDRRVRSGGNFVA